MRTLLIISILAMAFVVSNCEQIKDSKIITSEVNELSKKENCQLTYLDQSIDDSSNLTVTLHCSSKDEFFPGKITLSLFESLNKKGIIRDSYSVKDSKNNAYGGIDLQGIQQVVAKKKEFDKHFQLLTNLNRDDLSSMLHDSLKPKIVNEEWYNRMFETLKSNQRGWEFDGFILEDQDTVSYVTFGRKLKNEVIIWFSYKISNKGTFSSDNKIYALGLTPLGNRSTP